MTSHYLKADLLLVLVTLLAACGWIFSKEALIGLPPILFIGLRFLLAGMTLTILGQRQLRQLSKRELLKASATGLLFAVAMIFWILGLFHAKHIGEGAFITSMGVVIVPIIAIIFFREKPSKETWVALPVAISGLACLSLNQGFSLEAGQFYFLTAAIIFATHFNLTSKMVASIPPLALSAVQLVVVGYSALTTSFFFEFWPDAVAPDIWGWFLASALIATSLRFWLQTKAQSLAPASHVVVILTLEPIWTAILAGYWFTEEMSATQLLGCSLILCALLVSRWRWLRILIKG